MAGIDAFTQDLQQHRSYFAALGNKAYFNYGGQGVLPKQAMAAIFCSYDYVQTNGPFSTKLLEWLEDELQKTKIALGNELNVDSHSLAITQSASEGCNIAMWGIDWQQGDHLMLTDSEHPSIVAIAEQVAGRFQVEVTFVPISDRKVDVVSAIKENFKPRTKLVALSHVLWNTGRILPIAEIAAECHQRDAKLLVDGAQSGGMLPLDLQALDVDFYAIAGQKWFCGPEGIGAFYIRPALIEQLKPTYVGWRGVELGRKDCQDANRFEVATGPFPLLAGLRASLELHHAWASTEERYEQLKKNARYLRDQLKSISSVRLVGDEDGSGIITFAPQEKTPTELVRQLEAEGILLRSIPYPRCVRACVHYFTDKREMDKLAVALNRT